MKYALIEVSVIFTIFGQQFTTAMVFSNPSCDVITQVMLLKYHLATQVAMEKMHLCVVAKVTSKVQQYFCHNTLEQTFTHCYEGC